MRSFGPTASGRWREAGLVSGVSTGGNSNTSRAARPLPSLWAGLLEAGPMRTWKARTLAAAIAVAGAGVAAVLFFFGLAIRDWVVEEYWIRRLDSKDAAEWKAAARKLAILKSPRAVPHLVRQL